MVASFARYVPSGNKSRVVTMLNSVWKLAICAAGLPGVNCSTISVKGKHKQMTVKIIVPITLNIK